MIGEKMIYRESKANDCAGPRRSALAAPSVLPVLPVFLALFCALSLLSACAGDGRVTRGQAQTSAGTAAASREPADREVLLYATLQERQMAALQEGLQKKYPDIRMRYYYADAGALSARILTEHQSGRDTADVVLMDGMSVFEPLRQAGVFQSAGGAGDGGGVIALRACAVLIYNRLQVKEDDIPTGWRDLTDPRWRGQIIMADPTSDGVVQDAISALMENPAYGETYIRGLQANGCQLESGALPAQLQVAEGSCRLGIAEDYIAKDLVDEGRNIGIVYPREDGIRVNAPVALTKAARHPAEGRALIDFILSREGQEILARNHTQTVREDIVTRQPEQSGSLMEVDWDSVSEKAGRYMEIFDRIFNTY